MLAITWAPAGGDCPPPLLELVVDDDPDELLDPEVLEEPPEFNCEVVVLVELVEPFEFPHPTIASDARPSPAIA